MVPTDVGAKLLTPCIYKTNLMKSATSEASSSWSWMERASCKFLSATRSSSEVGLNKALVAHSPGPCIHPAHLGESAWKVVKLHQPLKSCCLSQEKRRDPEMGWKIQKPDKDLNLALTSRTCFTTNLGCNLWDEDHLPSSQSIQTLHGLSRSQGRMWQYKWDENPWFHFVHIYYT